MSVISSWEVACICSIYITHCDMASGSGSITHAARVQM